MKVSILHLSDIHFTVTKDNPILNLTDAIASAVSSCPCGDSIIIVVTGDIASSGRKEEYDIAAKFFEDLQLKIDQRARRLPSLVVVPGNHDCDFTLPNQAREIVLNGISNSSIEQVTYDLGTSVQVEYNAFTVNTATALDVRAKGIGYTICQLAASAPVIVFRMHNTAWMSKPKEITGIVLPVTILPPSHSEVLLGADLSLGIMHHTFSWLRPDCSRQLRADLHATCDIVLTGHEHEPGGYQSRGYKNEIIEYLEGGVLQSPNNPKESSFNFICIDTEEEVIDIHQFTLKNEMYSRLENSYSRKFTRNIRRMKKMFSISEAMNKQLQDLEIIFKHPYKGSLFLDDLFVYPEYNEIAYPGSGRKTQKTILEASVDLLNDSHYVYFAAPEKAGKTMFAKRLFLDLHAQGTVPILAKGKTFKKSDDKYIRDCISELISEQYSKDAFEPYLQLACTERVIIIDDYDQVSLKGKHRDNLLRNLAVLFDKVILFGHNDSRWEELYKASQSDERMFNPAILSYKHYEFVELGPVKRSDLVRRWHQAGAPGEIDPNEVHRKSIEAEEIISNTIGKNLLPAFPLFILLLIQQLESRDSATTAHGAQGYLYESLITNSLVSTSDYVADLDIKYKYLSELAYKLFDKNDHEIPIHEMEKWHIEHCNQYLISLDFGKLITDLSRAQILKERDACYVFVYPYMRYYFTARHIRDNIETSEAKEFIKNLTTKLHWQEAANILIFVAYLCKDAFVLNTIIESASNLFSDTAIFDYAAPPDFLTPIKTTRAKLILDAVSPEQARREELVIREKIERESQGSDINEDDLLETAEGISRINSITSATKTIQILGQILRSFPGSLSAIDKMRITKECYNLSLRVTGFCIAFLEKYGPEISEALVKLTTTLHPESSKEVLEQETRAFVYGLCERISFGMVKHVSGAVGLEELAPVFKKIAEDSNNRSYEIFGLSIKLDHHKHFPKVEAIEIYENLNNVIFSRDLIRKLVWYHLHMFPLSYDIRQSICKKLGIDLESHDLLSMGRMISK